MGLLLLSAHGQQKQGRVLYERTVQMEMRMQGPADEMAQVLPHSHKDKLEVLFGNDQSLRRNVADEIPEDLSSGEGGMMVLTMVADANDVTYSNFATGETVEQREFGAKNYIIADSIRKLNWKVPGVTSTILGYPCLQAIAQRIGKRASASIENGKLETHEIPDTANIIVWFTPAIPVPAGPEYQGQLPGLILGIDINDGKTVYTATEVSAQTELSAIKAPSKGKKVTVAEFTKERDKMVGEMRRTGTRATRVMGTRQ